MITFRFNIKGVESSLVELENNNTTCCGVRERSDKVTNLK